MVFITISSPHEEEEGTRQRYTSYLISTDRGNSVRRRYSDFVWLYNRLKTELPGAIVPIIPHSRALIASKKFDPDFIEGRRRDLQQFLQGVVDDDELARAPSMSPFMVDGLGNDLEEGKKTVEARTPTSMLYTTSTEEDYGFHDKDQIEMTQQKARRGIGNFFAKIRVTTGSKELMATGNENEVTALQDYITEVAGYAKTLVKATDSLVKYTADMASTYDEMGVPIGEWRTVYQNQQEAQKSNSSAQEIMTTLVEFATDFSTLVKKKHIEEEEKFGFQVHRLVNTVTAFQMALKQRRNIQVQYTATNKQIIDKDAALEKAHKNLKPPEITDKIQDERTELEKRCDLEKKVLEECTERLLRYAEIYKPMLIVILKNAFLQYSKIQLAYTNRINQAFTQLVPYLDDSEVNGSGDASEVEDDAGAAPMGAPPPAPSVPPPPPPVVEDDKDDGEIEVEDLDGSLTSTGEIPEPQILQL
ncbi:MAG: hypothetical protein SGILL_006769 [Bacillariaceae sp.]